MISLVKEGGWEPKTADTIFYFTHLNNQKRRIKLGIQCTPGLDRRFGTDLASFGRRSVVIDSETCFFCKLPHHAQ
ncbi:hypothetical protein LPE01_18230 [Lactiplantibacillus pentosus]|nr:hypothetical protein LPE01_18230 [Lactiplantibacillus pentosus]